MNRSASGHRGLSSLLFLSLLMAALGGCTPGDSRRGGDNRSGGEAEVATGESITDVSDEKLVTIAFYNVENLFDTEDDPAVDDDEFTPRGGMKWTEQRLERKLEDLARAISSIDDGRGADILGLAEVENRPVLERLVADFFPGRPMEIVHEDSPDGRGIDVALLYRSEIVAQRNHSYHHIDLGPGERPTRGILNVELEREGESFNVLVNHWPSRSGGKERSRWKRERAAGVLRKVIDSIEERAAGRDIVVIGDFNDTPTDRSLQDVLGAGDPADADRRLLNLAWPIAAVDTFGTYLYRDDWNVLDQVIVARSLLDNQRLELLDREMTIFAPPFLRDDHPSQPMLPPRRTYIRRSLYIGGTSDHFPVFVRFRWAGRSDR